MRTPLPRGWIRRHVGAAGPVAAAEVWDRYARPGRWTSWAPHLTSVRASTAILEPGTTGSVTALGVVPVAFTVTAVDPGRMTWSWTVRCGPLTLDLDHVVRPGEAGRGSVSEVCVAGPAPVVIAYVPLMRLALRRLVSRVWSRGVADVT